MCGIVGVAGDLTSSHQRLFDLLLYLDAQRGWDSTGLLTVNPDAGETSILKSAIPAADFIREPAYATTRKTSDVLWLGHNRAATVGEVNDRTAHPFDRGSVIGVHNGTLATGWKGRLVGDNSDCQIDSEALIESISAQGLEETIKSTIGAYAVVYYDKPSHSLNFIRNSQRPLVWAFTKDRKSFWFCSDPSMYMMARRTTRSSMELDGKDMFTEAQPHVHYKLHLPDRYGIKMKDKMLERTSIDPVRRRAGPVTQRSFHPGPSSRLPASGGTHFKGPQAGTEAFKGRSPTVTPKKAEGSKGGARGTILKVTDIPTPMMESALEERKAAVLAWEEFLQNSENRFDNDMYMDCIYAHVLYELTDPPGSKEDVELKYWQNSLKRLIAETKVKIKDCEADILKSCLTRELVDLRIRLRVRLETYKDMLSVSDHSFWDNQLWQRAKDEPGDSLPAVDDYGGADSADKGAEVTPPKPQGVEEEYRKFDALVSETPCQCCKKLDQHPDITETYVSPSEGVVCSTCMRDPLILNLVREGNYDVP